MKRFKYFIPVLVLGILFFASCDILEEEVVSGVTSDTFYSTPEGFADAVDASYQPLRSYYGSEHGGNLTAMGTDIITNGGHGGYHYMNNYDAELNSESSPFWSLWSNFYQAINTTNAAISRAQNVDMPEEEKNTKLGEVHFLRAHYYFLLVEHFGAVHLTLEETEGVETEAERNPEDVIYEAIISDLEFAIQNLPTQQEEFGRVTEPAAKNMLGVVLLTRGYKDFAQPDDFSRAAGLFREIINNYNFVLLDDVMDPFDHDNEQNAEVIWSVQYTQDPLLNGDGNRSHLHYRPWYEVFNDGLIRANDPGYGRPWIRFRPTQFAMENYRPLDVDSRYKKFFQDVWYYNDEGGLPSGAAVGDTAIWVTDQFLTQEKVDELSSNLPGVNLMTWNKDNEDDPWYWHINMFPMIKKVNDWKRPSTNYANGSRDYIVYRLADTYLMTAEALLQDGRPEEAVEYVNAIRTRAAWPGMENEMMITAGELDLDFILDERARELYAEQKRWLDLKRTRKLVDRVQMYNPTEAQQNIQDYHMLRPIPANQITRTQAGYQQNPGY
ncbi:RagB/SusD family nutrient uptake outer membrane protein [Rhodohalobacter sulfatireducens]|uniref:RagB/SusD family nutrient uptake outer membrane protein n=1 Tax=Rhodohalobacter sulfatireducens TaxID=2911366 RepID=A0ABS9KJ67_9BACT|nr:RagB/SusD family nutrient uptake outer membrane protein [Rhodohalobacter sulfatireducens]MCG2590881.1 RagB/SusD family nutrient uptake outer membrane protein [Rhodohalobacter sulfatireducens]